MPGDCNELQNGDPAASQPTNTAMLAMIDAAKHLSAQKSTTEPRCDLGEACRKRNGSTEYERTSKKRHANPDETPGTAFEMGADSHRSISAAQDLGHQYATEIAKPTGTSAPALVPVGHPVGQGGMWQADHSKFMSPVCWVPSSNGYYMTGGGPWYPQGSWQGPGRVYMVPPTGAYRTHVPFSAAYATPYSSASSQSPQYKQYGLRALPRHPPRTDVAPINSTENTATADVESSVTDPGVSVAGSDYFRGTIPSSPLHNNPSASQYMMSTTKRNPVNSDTSAVPYLTVVPLAQRAIGSSEDLAHLHDVWNPTKAQEKILKERGIFLRRSTWTKSEEAQLNSNLDRARDVYKTDDLAAYAKENFSSRCRRTPESKKFFRLLGEGICRPLHAIYRRFTRQIVDVSEAKGKKYSEDDLKRLQELHKEHGKDFNKIGKLLGRTSTSVRDRLRVLAGPKALRWSIEEEQKLVEVICRLTKRPKSDLIQSNIPWEAVALEMKPRAPHQCQQKWLGKVAWQACASARAARTVWSTSDDIELRRLIESCAVTDESEIDWNLIAERFTGAVRTGYILKQTWKRILAKTSEP